MRPQVELKARRKAAAKIAELQEAAQVQLSLAEQDALFARYADECIAEYAARGKPTAPMTLHVGKKVGLEQLV